MGLEFREGGSFMCHKFLWCHAHFRSKTFQHVIMLYQGNESYDVSMQNKSYSVWLVLGAVYITMKQRKMILNLLNYCDCLYISLILVASYAST